MKNRRNLKHGMLPDFTEYLERTGWKIEETKGQYEVLRARKAGYPHPLLVFDRERGCGYSIDERDIKIYNMYGKDRESRGLDLWWATQEEGNGYFTGK